MPVFPTSLDIGEHLALNKSQIPVRTAQLVERKTAGIREVQGKNHGKG